MILFERCAQGKAAAAAEYGDQTPAENSIVHMLARASDKTSGQSLTDIQIVAQTYTFMLAGAGWTAAASGLRCLSATC